VWFRRSDEVHNLSQPISCTGVGILEPSILPGSDCKICYVTISIHFEAGNWGYLIFKLITWSLNTDTLHHKLHYSLIYSSLCFTLIYSLYHQLYHHYYLSNIQTIRSFILLLSILIIFYSSLFPLSLLLNNFQEHQ